MAKSLLLQQALKFFIVPAGIGTMITTICLTNVSKPLYKLDKLKLEEELPKLREPRLRPVYVAQGGTGDGTRRTGSGVAGGESSDEDYDDEDDEDGDDEGTGDGEEDGEGGSRSISGGDTDTQEEPQTESTSEEEQAGKEPEKEEEKPKDNSEEDSADSVPEDEEDEEDKDEDEEDDNEDTSDEEEEEENEDESEGPSSQPKEGGEDQGVPELLQGGTHTVPEILSSSIKTVINLDLNNLPINIHGLDKLSKELERIGVAVEYLDQQEKEKQKTVEKGAKEGETVTEGTGSNGEPKASVEQPQQ